MAEWNKNKVEPSAINNGQEFKLKDNLAIDELNAIVNNSFYASDKAKRAEELAESAVKGQGTPVTLNGEVLPTWSADFAENERQKSKNLLVYPYTGEVYQYGVTFTDNGDGSFTINGKQTDTTANSYHYMETADTFKLSAGTYTLKAFADTSVTGWNLVLYDGEYYHEVSSPNMAKTLTFNEDKYCGVYIQVPKASTTTFNNFVVKPILVKGTEIGEWQPYNGAIVHEKDIAGITAGATDVVYDYSDTSKQSINGTAYTNGLMFGYEYKIDLNKYKKIILTISAGSKSHRVLCEIPILSQGSNRGSFVGIAYVISSRTLIFGSEGYDTDDKVLYLYDCYTSTIGVSDGVTSYSNSTSYTVTKIEGVY